MKILAIRGKNLASLEGEFSIDFTEEPLKSAGIFAITGATGSGKSTILDALCLALFDNTPRTNHAGERAENADGISSKDSRNMLRRGTSNGYAEVDFISLAGEKYRSRWSVRRARDKVNGSLQNSTFELQNLTTNTEEQGRKTELLAKVVELIGLTFDQFTRAVLLAQGDFATFLKAKQNEKAELLEKLTGTEIYSRISKAIYDNSKEASDELSILKARIADIELLSDENIELFSNEKRFNQKEIERTSGELELLKNKIKWIDDFLILGNSVEEAEKVLGRANLAIEEAKLRYDYLGRVDNVQDIRDDFNRLKSSRQQLGETEKRLKEQKEGQVANTVLLEQAAEKTIACESELATYNNDFEKVKSLITQARALDAKLSEAKNSFDLAQTEYNQTVKRKQELERVVVKTKSSISSATQVLTDMNSWFEQREAYRGLIPNINLIVSLLENYTADIRQKGTNTNILVETKELLENDLRKLEEERVESERLNKLLPTEIVTLRATLEEGTPCPVCGSTHHPISGVTVESLEEAELNRAKKEVAERIERLTNRIDKRKEEVTRLAILIDNYTQQISATKERLSTLLLVLPEWETLLEQSNLQHRLTTLATDWNKKESDKIQTNEELAKAYTTLKLKEQELADATANGEVRESTCKEAKEAFDTIQEARSALLDGKGADVVERSHQEKIKDISSRLEGLKKEQAAVVAKRDELLGAIGQTASEVERLVGLVVLQQETIDAWLASKEGKISAEELTELLSKSNEWLTAERKHLNDLHQCKTAASATLAERKSNLDKHNSLENRPTEEESRELLAILKEEKEGVVKENTERNMVIDALFVNHENGRKRIEEIETELNKKNALSENWRKLNELLGSADGAKFKVLAQGYTLEVLLGYANKHLQMLSNRYEIQRIPNTLALQVSDLDMAGETRTVHSLSGGESFLVSLALALGLSSLSSNKMAVESLFIDEGFGSLDMETLRVAIGALERLQTQGRKIGVISHVTEMTERIGTKICVEKMASGKSKVEIQ